MRLFIGILTLAINVMAVNSAGAAPWVFAMADTVRVSSSVIYLSDLTAKEVPSHLARLNVGAAGKPGCVQVVSRKSVLRKLVTAGAASGVSFRGAPSCVVMRTGEALNPHALRPEIRRELQPLVPAAKSGAPATWFDLELPTSLAVVDGENFRIRIDRTSPLEPGRNQISIILDGTKNNLNFPVTVTLHQFSETAKARLKIKRGDPLIPELFEWSWTDLADQRQVTDFHGRDALMGACCARTIQAGDYLRQCDLKATPVVFSGELVELQIQRGGLFVSVKATARREGSIGQTIPVRNELTKRLVNARVVGPGFVKWRN